MTEAVKRCLSKYVVFQGRAGRPEYWWWVLAYLIVYVVVLTLALVVHVLFILVAIVVLGALLPGVAVLFRRLHDTGRSGWWWLIGFVPLVGAIVLLVFVLLPGDPGPNAYGAPDPL